MSELLSEAISLERYWMDSKAYFNHIINRSKAQRVTPDYLYIIAADTILGRGY